MQRKFGLALGLVFAFAAVANAVPTIVVGDHELLPNTPHQAIQIFVTGGDANLQGVNFNAQIGDGGPDLGGVTVGPGFDGTPNETLITAPQIFAGNNTGVNDANGGAFGNLVAWLSTTTNAGFVSADGLLATIYIDTTGWFGGTWPLILGPGNEEDGFNSNGSTDFAGIEAIITDGTITIPVPEPSSIALGLFAAAGLGAVVARRRRA